MIKTIQLHGALANKYSADPIQIDADTPHLITSGLICMFGPEFKQDVREGVFEFLCTNTENGTKEYIHDELTAGKVVDCDRIDFTPVPAGSGRFGQIIIGIVLIVVGVVAGMYPGGQAASPYLINAGVAMLIGGIIQLIMAVPIADTLENERPENMPSFVFN